MKFTFSHRILSGFILIAILLVLVGYFAFLTTKSLQKVSNAIMKENVSSLKAAEELELALVNQKGLVASYFLDGDSAWLNTLEEKKKDFEVWFKNAQEVALTPGEKEILKEILVLYNSYDNQRNKAIQLYKEGYDSEAKKILLIDMKNSIDYLYQRCEDLISANEALIARAEVSSRKKVDRMTNLIWVTIVITLFLGSLMGFFMSHKISEQLIRSAKMASLGQLSANIAHEIRNPLTAIKMRLYSLSEELKNNIMTKEDLSVISEEIDRMEKTVKNFLDFARPPEPNFQKCDINQILEGTISLLSSKANSQNIRIKKGFNAIPSELEIDKEQMRQVFLNIILNAIDAMPNGGVLEITTSKHQDKKLKPIFEIKFKDTGSGLPVYSKKRLFEPFFTTKTEGTGLGLFIASRIIHMHEGLIEAESQFGKGTTLIIKLPLHIKFRSV